MVDQGCLTLERRKWMHYFDDVKAIVFITAINEYDQVCIEGDIPVIMGV